MLIILDDFSVKCNPVFIPSKDENENRGEIKVAHLKLDAVQICMGLSHFMIFIA